jgi:hypothetical protein
MARKKSNDSKDGNLPDALGYLAKAWDWTWALRIASLLLFADIVISHRTGRGLVQWQPESPVNWIGGIGPLAVILVAFALTMSFAIPLMAAIVRATVGEVSLQIPARFFPSSHSKRPKGAVRRWELSDYAFEKDSQFLLDIVHDHDRQQLDRARNDQQTSSLVFGIVVLVGADIVFGGAGGLIRTIVALSEYVPYMFFFGFIGACMVLKSCWFPRDPLGWIDYPPLYKLIEKDRLDALQRMKNFL